MLHYANGNVFASGRARFHDQDPAAAEPTAKIFVRIELPGLEGPLLAELDTGAAWSLLNSELAESLELLDEDGESTSIQTAKGKIAGRIMRVALSIIADEGTTLELDASMLISKDWNGPTFLGYSGLLEGIRFGVDPQANQFYFGRY